MGRMPLASRGAPSEALTDLLGPGLSGLAIWAGKPAKTDRRIFLHSGTSDGRLWFAKVSDEDRDGLRSEYEALCYVQILLAGSPYHDACRQQVQYREGVIVQEWCTGISLRTILLSGRTRFWQRSRIASDCALITRWLSGFHAAGVSEVGKQRTLSTRGATHGDFKPANVLLRGGTPLSVVDWELFDPDGVQIHDLFHFLLYFGMTLTAPDRMKGLRRTLFERNWISEIARSCLWLYMGESRVTAPALVEAFEHYIKATLERRTALGLSNTGYFLTEARTLTSSLSSMPYAFEPPGVRRA